MTKRTAEIRLRMTFDDETMSGPTVACVLVSEDDLTRWRRLADYVSTENVHCMQAFDPRCRFFYVATHVDDEDDIDDCDLVRSPFRQDATTVKVYAHGVRWAGWEKACGSRSSWSTQLILLSEIEEALGLGNAKSFVEGEGQP